MEHKENEEIVSVRKTLFEFNGRISVLENNMKITFAIFSAIGLSLLGGMGYIIVIIGSLIQKLNLPH